MDEVEKTTKCCRSEDGEANGEGQEGRCFIGRSYMEDFLQQGRWGQLHIYLLGRYVCWGGQRKVRLVR